MFSNRFGFAVLALACVVAAGTGGYLASRQNAVTPAPVAAAAPSPAESPAPAVQETEAIVGDPAKTAAAEPPSRTSVAKRADTTPRAQAGKPDKRQPTAVAQSQTSPPPTLERSWPSSTARSPSENGATQPDVVSPRQEETHPAEASRAPEPPAKTFEELVVAANSVIGLQMDTAITSETAKVEDRVEARVIRDVRVGGQVAVPAGSRAIGSVMTVDRGGKLKERAKLGIRFNSLVLEDGTRVPITTETIYREGQSPANASAAKIGGGTVVGTILGAMIGGAKGAAVGAAVGAGGGSAAVMAGDRNAATFPPGTEVTARLISPVTVTIEK